AGGGHPRVALTLLGVGDRPGEALYQLLCGMAVGEMDRADSLVEKHAVARLRARAQGHRVGRHDDPGHESLLPIERHVPGWGCSPGAGRCCPGPRIPPPHTPWRGHLRLRLKVCVPSLTVFMD